MTVKELITVLYTLPPESEVKIFIDLYEIEIGVINKELAKPFYDRQTNSTILTINEPD